MDAIGKESEGPRTIADLRPAGYNPRKISPEALKSLARSLAEFGDLSGIIFNRATRSMIGGHQRIKALSPDSEIVIEYRAAEDFDGEKDGGSSLATGYVSTPFGRFCYREVSWSLSKEKAANLAANKQGGEWDFPKLKELLVDLDTGDFDLSLTGFDEKELQALIDYAAKEGEKAPKAAPELEGFRRAIFLLTDEQAETVDAALKKSIAAGPFAGTQNEDKNGNALFRICATYTGGES